MSKVTFGWKHFNSAAPAFIGKLRKAILYAMSGVGAFLPLIVEWTGWTPEKIIQVLGFTVFLLAVALEFFGAPIQTKTVPADQVTEIETNP